MTCECGECRACKLSDRLTDRAMRTNRPLLGKGTMDVKINERTGRTSVKSDAESARDRRTRRLAERVYLKDDRDPRGRGGYWYHPGDDVIHGTASAYTSYGCRCVECWRYDASKDTRRGPAAKVGTEVRTLGG